MAQTTIVALAVACTLLNAALGLYLLRKSLPATLKMRVEAIEVATATALKALDGIEAQVGTWKAAISALIEEAETVFDKVERKRASAAAKVSQLNAQTVSTDEFGIPLGLTPDQREMWINQRARERGL